MTSNEEQLLLKNAQGGDRAALGMLWDGLTPKLFGYLVNVLRDRNLAEDMLQNTWLRAIEALPKFQQRGVSVSAWLFAIARNECRQYWRKSHGEVPFDPAMHDRGTTDHAQDRLDIESVLASLSEDDRELIRLRYIADLPVSDIARIMNINFIAARVRLHRALARARAKII